MTILYDAFIIVLIVGTLPLQLFISAVITLTSGFPILFRQKRVGKDGKPFVLYKFRTMISGAETMQKKLQHLNKAHGPVFKMYNDPRYTCFGKFLAHTGLDELPQLYNVLRGDMALLGPRPLPVAEAAKLSSWQKARERIKPGIISPWILDGYHKTTFNSWMRSDIAYIKKKSFWYDAGLAGKTVVFLTTLLIRELLQ